MKGENENISTDSSEIKSSVMEYFENLYPN
jgi:hypothetical protein